jgi:DNA repair protein RecN (Recombination protein N)
VAALAVQHLKDLGFDDPVVRFVLEPTEPGPGGAERVTLHFSSDSRLRVGPITRVASGGELSRLVLSIRLAAGAGDAQVIAFDEIDAGVGGATALAMGEKLAALARDRQVLCVTHLPQVAAFADSHFVVDRDGPRASVRLVAGDEERLGELSRMLSGMPDSGAAQGHAQELRTRAITARSS